MVADRSENCTLKPYFYIFVAQFLYPDLCNYKSNMHLQKRFQNISG